MDLAAPVRTRNGGGGTFRGPFRRTAGILVLAALYAALGRLGLAVGPVHTFAALVWPPAGISLAALLLGGYGLWPGIALGALTVNILVGARMPVALGISLGNALEAIAGAYLFRRLSNSRDMLDGIRPVLAFTIPCAVASTVVGATVGVGSLLLGGQLQGGAFVETWRTWWLGDLVGDLTVGSLVLAWCGAPLTGLERRRVPELAALAAFVAGASVLIFARSHGSGGMRFLQASMLLPLLMWGALRFGMRGATATVFLASVIAVCGTAYGQGPFVEQTLARSLLLLQGFMAVTTSAVLVLGAATAEREGEFCRAEAACRRSEALAALGRTLNRGVALKEVLEKGIAQILGLLGSDDGFLCLAEQGGEELRVAFESPRKERVGTLLRVDELPRSRLAVEERRLVYLSKRETFGKEAEWCGSLGIEAALVVPLIGEAGSLIGLLYVNFWDDRFRWSSEAVQFASAAAELCGLAVARARTYEAERGARLDARRATQRLSLSQSITAELSRARTQSEVARIARERCIEAVGAKAVGVFVPISSEELDLAKGVEWPFPATASSRVRIDSNTPCAEAFRSGKPVWIASPQDAALHHPGLSREETGTGAWAAIPLVGDRWSHGVLTLTFSEPHPFGTEDQHFISSIAGKLGQAFERASLYEAERVARARAEVASVRAELLASFGASLNAGQSLPEVLRAATNGAKVILGGDDAALWIAEGDVRHLRGAFETEAMGRVEARQDLDQLPHSREAVSQGRALYFTVGEAEGAERTWFERLGMEAAVVAPLLSEGRFVGVLFVDYLEDRFGRSEEDFRFVGSVAGLCALAVTRAQVFESEKKARVRAEAAENEAKQLVALQEQLVAVVGHDLRNPLAAIVMGVQRLSRRRREVEAWEQSVIALLSRSADRMQGIIRDVLDLANARRHRGIPVKPSPVKLADVCRHAIAELAEARSDRSILLRVEGDDEGEWDPDRMMQVVSNLVANALEHGSEDATIEVRIRGSARNLVLEVYNSGPPIPSELLAKVFEAFTTGASPVDGAKNLGLGLFIVREIARAHRGTVDVCSRPGHGTSFVVKLPRWQKEARA